MKLLLDTNICIYLIKKRPPSVLRHFTVYQAGTIGISSITVAELEFDAVESSLARVGGRLAEKPDHLLNVFRFHLLRGFPEHGIGNGRGSPDRQA